MIGPGSDKKWLDDIDLHASKRITKKCMKTAKNFLALLTDVEYVLHEQDSKKN